MIAKCTAGESRRKIALSVAGAPEGVTLRFGAEADASLTCMTLTVSAVRRPAHILTVRATYGEEFEEANLSATIIDPGRARHEQP